METQNQYSEQEVLELFSRYMVPNYKRSLTFTHGQGTSVWDINGKQFMDFGGGIAVNALGHAHPAIVRALNEQSAKLIHTSNLYHTIPQAVLAKKIVEASAPGKVFFCNSGAEANEALYKLARKAAQSKGLQKFEILTAVNSFHGRTLAGIAATGQDKVRHGFDPITPGFRYVPFNDLDAVAAAITNQTAAVLIEGIQGEAGVFPVSPEYLLGLRRLCTEKGILLMMDEIQAGMFRTGRFLSYQRLLEEIPDGEQFVPDAVSMAKSLGGGYPIGAVWIASQYADVFQPGSHGTTYGGTPLACAVSLSVFDTIEKEGLAQNARRQGERMVSRLTALMVAHPDKIKAVRGFGCMVGVEFAEEVTAVGARLVEAGLLLIPSGTHIMRWLPPLNITDEESERALELFEKGLLKANVCQS